MRGVSKTFGKGPDAIQAIEELSLDIEEGEFMSLVGPSGSGKTTLIKIIAGLLPATSGEVLLRDVAVTQPIQDFGIVFQSPVLLPWRSALRNVLLPIEMLGLDKSKYVDRARELLELVGLEGFEDRRPQELSGGMKQRVSICRALIHDPAILLMDEPFGALDQFTREALNDHLLALWSRSQKTVLFVTHNIGEAVYLSDRIAVMTPRPARLVDVVDVNLPRPRDPDMRYEAEVVEQLRKVQQALRSGR